MKESTNLTVNIVSESAITVQGHGVHTAYIEMCHSLEARGDVTVIRNEFDRRVTCDVIHLHTIGPRVFRKLFQKGPVKVISAHVVPDSFVGSLIGARLWKPFATMYLKWFYGKADALLAVSDATAVELKSLGVKVPIHVSYNSIDTARYRQPSKNARRDIRKKLGIDGPTFMVVGAGQVQPRKRVDLFIKAAQALPDVAFVWVGGMPFGRVAADYADMKKMIDTASSNVYFPGQFELEEMVSFYHSADLFWLPSEQETFGLVVLEAAASGLPVLLRDIPDYESTFGAEACYGTDESFFDLIRRFSQDKTFRETYIEKAAVLAERFDSKAAAEQLVTLYHELLSDRLVQ